MEEGPPNMEAPPDGKYLGKLAHGVAWQVGRWVTIVAGRSTPRGQSSVVKAFRVSVAEVAVSIGSRQAHLLSEASSTALARASELISAVAF